MEVIRKEVDQRHVLSILNYFLSLQTFFSVIIPSVFVHQGPWNMGFPCSSVGKESACNAGDLGSSPGSGRSGEENGNPLQYSCLGNPMDRGAWWASVYGLTHKHRLLLLLLFSCFTLSDFLYFPYGLQFVRLLCPWNSLGKSTRVGCHALLQGIFLTQGLKLCLLYLLHWLAGSLPLAPPGKAPYISIYTWILFSKMQMPCSNYLCKRFIGEMSVRKKGKNPEEAGRVIRQWCRYDPCERRWERRREGRKVGLIVLDLTMFLENFNQASQESLYQSCLSEGALFLSGISLT